MSYCLIIRAPQQFGNRLYYLNADGQLATSIDKIASFPSYDGAQLKLRNSYDKLQRGWICEIATMDQAMILSIMSE